MTDSPNRPARLAFVIATACAIHAVIAAPPPPSPLFHCSFDSAFAADRAGGRAEPISMQGVTRAEGFRGQGLRLAGAEGPATIVYSTAGNLDPRRGAIRLRMRLDWDYTQNTSRSKRVVMDLAGPNRRTRMYLHTLSGGLVFGVFDATGEVHAVYGRQATGWPAGTWHEVVCTWDASQGYVALALDGELAGAKTGVERWQIEPDSIATLRLGGYGARRQPLGGTLDDFTISDQPVRFAQPDDGISTNQQVELTARKQQAAQALARLESAIASAEANGVDASYAAAVATASDVGLWRMVRSPRRPGVAETQAICDYMVTRCAEAETELAELVRDPRFQRRVPHPEVRGLRPVGDGFRNAAGEEVLLIGLRNVDISEFPAMTRFFNHVAWSSSPSMRWQQRAAGYNLAAQVHLFWNRRMKQAVKEVPAARNVGGWCGHNWAQGLCVDRAEPRRLLAASVLDLSILKRPQPESAAYTLLSAEDEYMCYCGPSVTAFREWCRRRYPGIAAANALWGTRFAAFDEVVPPRHTRTGIGSASRGLWYDWQQFNRARTTAVYAWLKRLVRSRWPTIPVCGGTHIPLANNQWGSKGVDPEGLNATVHDVAQCETVYGLPTASSVLGESSFGMDLFGEMATDFQRSTCDLPLTDLEFHAWLRTARALSERKGNFPANYTYTAVLRHFLHGIRTANLWVWSRKTYRAEDYSSIAGSAEFPLGAVEEALRAGLDIRRLTPELLALSRAPKQVAMLVTDAAFMQIPPERARDHRDAPLIVELRNVYHGAMFLDTPIGFVSERSIAAGALQRYRVVLVPAITHIDDTTLQALMAFVSRGGRMIITPRSFARDPYHRPRQRPEGFPQVSGLGFAGFLKNPTDAQLADPGFIERQALSPGDPRIPEARIDANEWDALRFAARDLAGVGVRLRFGATPNGQVLGRFRDDRSPAIIRTRHGAGAIYHCAIPLRPRSYARVAEAVFGEAGVNRPVRLLGADGEPAWGVESWVCAFGDDRRDLLVAAVNLRAAPVQLALSGERTILGVHDLIANQPGATRFTLKPLETRLLRLKVAD
jgi:hypothetical protein